MKKLYRLTSAVLSCLCAGTLLFFSCTPADEISPEETDTAVLADPVPGGVPLHIPTDGKIDFTGFSDTGNADSFSSDCIYTFTPIPALNENYDLTSCKPHAVDETRIVLLADIYTENTKLLTYDITDGTVTETPLPIPDDLFAYGESFQYARQCEDGTFLVVSRTRPYQEAEMISHIFRLSADGTLLAKAELPDGYSGYNILPLLGDRIAVDAADMLFIYDRDLQLLWSEAGADAMCSPDGDLYIEQGFGGSYVLVDTENNTSTSQYPLKPTNFQNGRPTLYFSGAASVYDAYFTSQEGFWGMQEGDTEATLLCGWQDSGIKYGDLTILSILDAHTVFAALADPFSDTDAVYGMFEKARETGKSKTVITLGIVDNTVYRPSDITLTDAINRFNAINEDYFVDIVRYAGTSNNYQDGSIPDAFTEAMLSGTAADIIVSSDRARTNMQIYREKGAFADLSRAVADVLIPAVKNAYIQRNGTLSAIPMNMQLSLLTANAYFVSDTDTLSLARVYALDKMARDNGAALSNCPEPETLLNIAVPSFADADSGECRYNTPDFASFLTFYESYDAAFRASENLHPLRRETHVTDYYFETPDFLDALRMDEFLLLETPFYSIHAYPILKLFYEEQRFSLHGYPTDGGEVVSLDSELDFSINASSDVLNGALSFLAFLLSDDIQSSTTLTDTALPVTYSGCERLLENRTYYFSKDFVASYGYDDRYHIAYMPPSSVEYYLTNERESVRNALDDIAVTVTLTDDDIAALRRLFYTSETRSLIDVTMRQIIEEELSAYRAGAQTLERTQEILQSRLFLYINE